MSDQPLQGILKDLSDLGKDRDKIPMGELVRTLEARGFGPLLLVLAALMLLPIGMLPGFPAIVGLLFLLCGAQMVRGANGVWLPNRLSNMDIPGEKYRSSLDKVWPVVSRMRRFIGGRLHWAVSGTAVRVIAVMLIILGAAMVALGFIPGLPFILALPVLLFGLGLTAGDGLVVLIGFALLAPTIWAVIAGV